MTGLARTTDPDTSHEAAHSVDTRSLDQKILDALHQYGPGSSEDLAAWTGLHRVSVSPRLKPLEERGVVSRRGRKRNLRGQRVIEWAVADANAKADLKSAMTAIEQYVNTFGAFPTSEADLADAK